MHARRPWPRFTRVALNRLPRRWARTPPTGWASPRRSVCPACLQRPRVDADNLQVWPRSDARPRPTSCSMIVSGLEPASYYYYPISHTNYPHDSAGWCVRSAAPVPVRRHAGVSLTSRHPLSLGAGVWWTSTGGARSPCDRGTPSPRYKMHNRVGQLAAQCCQRLSPGRMHIGLHSTLTAPWTAGAAASPFGRMRTRPIHEGGKSIDSEG